MDQDTFNSEGMLQVTRPTKIEVAKFWKKSLEAKGFVVRIEDTVDGYVVWREYKEGESRI